MLVALDLARRSTCGRRSSRGGVIRLEELAALELRRRSTAAGAARDLGAWTEDENRGRAMDMETRVGGRDACGRQELIELASYGSCWPWINGWPRG
jgi:hypothetical protein